MAMSLDDLVRVTRGFCAAHGMTSKADRDAVAQTLQAAYEMGRSDGERMVRIKRNERESIAHAEDG